jgi:hypothetical protein
VSGISNRITGFSLLNDLVLNLKNRYNACCDWDNTDSIESELSLIIQVKATPDPFPDHPTHSPITPSHFPITPTHIPIALKEYLKP